MRRVFKAIALSPGRVKGKVVLSLRPEPSGAHQEPSFTEEVRRFFKALSAAKRELELLKTRIARSRRQREVFDIVEMYLMFLDDPTLSDYVVEAARSGKPVHKAVEEFFGDYEKRISAAQDRYLRERAKDIRHVKRFLLNKLHDVEVDWDEILSVGDVLVAPFISPVDVVAVAEKGVKALVVERGSETSHTSIVARSMGIPMVKLPDATELLSDGQEVVVDGYRGEVVVEPSPEDLKVQVLPEEVPQEAEELDVELYANVDFPEEAKVLPSMGAKGIGIFRTEYMYLVSRDWPTQGEQEAYLRRLLRYVDPSFPVNVRIADLGGDKVPLYAEYMREILNYRGIRFFMFEEELFVVHIRAILRAFAGRVLRLLVPMVSDVYELLWVKERVKRELDRLSGDAPEDVLYGAMVETPAGVIEIREIAAEADFVSVGTNDLSSFLYGIDRECRLPDYLEPPNNMAVVEAVRHVVKVAGADRVTLCGEVSRNKKYLPYLLKAGVKKLSVNPAFIPDVKRWIRELRDRA